MAATFFARSLFFCQHVCDAIFIRVQHWRMGRKGLKSARCCSLFLIGSNGLEVISKTRGANLEHHDKGGLVQCFSSSPTLKTSKKKKNDAFYSEN